MKISTGQIFDRAVTQMSTQQSKVAEMQAQLASGKQILQTSDDPDKAGLIQRLNTAYNRQETYESSLDSIEDRLGAEESALTATDNILQRIRELAVRASSDTLSAPDREILSIEVSTLKEVYWLWPIPQMCRATMYLPALLFVQFHLPTMSRAICLSGR